MHKRRIYLLLVLILAAGVVWFFPSAVNDEEEFSETAKVALRTVGNELLLSHQDSTSRVMPVIAMESFTYQLSFEDTIGLDPSRLVSIISEHFEKANLPEQYRVELIQCQDKEVAYSYEMRFKKENTIIPCGGRVLPPSCYTIEVQFTNVNASNGNKKWKFYTLIAFSILGFLVDFFLRKNKSDEDQTSSHTAYAKIGSFQFYPEQNKLVKEATEIALSKKECELLALLAAHPNQIMKREDLTKKVWEDNGVIVGRSLDTYISKLRKKLQSDASIKITNVHGVGYKLEH